MGRREVMALVDSGDIDVVDVDAELFACSPRPAR
jgi:hypothetical protein